MTLRARKGLRDDAATSSFEEDVFAAIRNGIRFGRFSSVWRRSAEEVQVGDDVSTLKGLMVIVIMKERTMAAFASGCQG